MSFFVMRGRYRNRDFGRTVLGGQPNPLEVSMRPIDDPADDELDDGPDRPRREPLGSPYAVPLGTLTAGAYVAITDQVQEHPQDVAGALPGPVAGAYGDSD
jgi:hypothetical protein